MLVLLVYTKAPALCKIAASTLIVMFSVLNGAVHVGNFLCLDPLNHLVLQKSYLKANSKQYSGVHPHVYLKLVWSLLDGSVL